MGRRLRLLAPPLHASCYWEDISTALIWEQSRHPRWYQGLAPSSLLPDVALAPAKLILCRTPQCCILLKATRCHHPLSSLPSLQQETSLHELVPLRTAAKSLASPPSSPPTALAQLCPHQCIHTPANQIQGVFFLPPDCSLGYLEALGSPSIASSILMQKAREASASPTGNTTQAERGFLYQRL